MVAIVKPQQFTIGSTIGNDRDRSGPIIAAQKRTRRGITSYVVLAKVRKGYYLWKTVTPEGELYGGTRFDTIGKAAVFYDFMLSWDE